MVERNPQERTKCLGDIKNNLEILGGYKYSGRYGPEFFDQIFPWKDCEVVRIGYKLYAVIDGCQILLRKDGYPDMRENLN